MSLRSNNPNSNVNNPKHVEYYQALTDVIAIFWEFHKTRLESGNIEFAYAENRVNGYFVPFVTDNDYYRWKEGTKHDNYPILNRFTQATTQTLRASWYQYLKALGYELNGGILDFQGISIPDEAKVFIDPYVKNLVDGAQELGLNVSRASTLEGYSVSDIVGKGLTTGVKVSTQLIGLMDEEFEPIMPVLLSKVALDHVSEARRVIGIDDKSTTLPVHFGLLDDSKNGLNEGMLRRMGYGDTLGCPAGRPTSQTTKQWLAERGVTTESSMLKDFAVVLQNEFEPVKEWAIQTEAQNPGTIDSQDMFIITGEARRTGIERSKNLREERRNFEQRYGSSPERFRG